MGSSKQCIVWYTKLVWSYCDATFCLNFKADRIPIGNQVCINVSTSTTKQTEFVLPPIATNKGVEQVVLWFHKRFQDSVQAYHLLASTVFLLFVAAPESSQRQQVKFYNTNGPTQWRRVYFIHNPVQKIQNFPPLSLLFILRFYKLFYIRISVRRPHFFHTIIS